MIGTADNISQIPVTSGEFHIGMLNIHARAATIIFDILDAMPYVDLQFALANAIWLQGMMGLIRYVSIRKK